MYRSRITPKAKSTLDMILRTETRKTVRKTRKKIKTIIHDKLDKSIAFVELCNADIMDTPLEFVEHKSWLSKDDVNIFIIGEVHSYRNYKETGIFEMFEQLVEKCKVRDIIVDIMLEISEGPTNREDEFYMRIPENLPNPNVKQMNNVRDLFRVCVGKHNCGKIRAHWVDNMTFSIDSTYKTSNTFTPFIPFKPVAPSRLRNHTARISSKHKLTPRFISPYSYHASVYSYKKSETPRVRRALETMPDWLITFYDDYDNHKYDDDYFGMDTSFRFQKGNDEDLLKLLDENNIAKKEIDKAADFQQRLKQETPVFDLEFATTMLKNLIQIWPNTTYKGKIFDTARAVMDIYTVARIIKSNMKNVIIYEGAFHAENVVYMLTKLGYTTNKIERRDVGPSLKKPIPIPVLPVEDDFLKDSDPELLTDV